MLKRIIYSILIILLILGATYAIFSFARGYRFDFGKKSITSTGILTASSYPTGASIFINGKLTSATNISINLSPGRYDVKIVKEGYIPWEKLLIVQGEIVTKADALLLPLNPSLRPLTSYGILSPVLSPTDAQLAYIVPYQTTESGKKGKSGIWIWDLKESQLISLGSGPKLLSHSSLNLDFSHAHLLWSPDEKQILALFFKDDKTSANNLLSAYILDTSLTDQTPINITESLATTLSDWNQIELDKDTTLLASLPPKLSDSLKDTSTDLQFSPDENKLMYTATASATLPPIITPPLIGTDSTVEDRNLIPGTVYIYDLKEDKNFKISQKSGDTPTSTPKLLKKVQTPPFPADTIVQMLSANQQSMRWYADSKHVLILENGTIYIMEYDGGNKTTIYAGPLEDSYIFPWPGGGRILILTNYNKAASLYPNLYAVDIR